VKPTRRGMLMGGAAFAALGLAPRFVLAEGKKQRKKKTATKDVSITGKNLATIEGKTPAGRENVLESKLSPDAQKLADLLLGKTKSAFALAVANPSTKFQAGSLHATGLAAYMKLSAKRQTRAKTRATAQLAAPSATKTITFGNYAKAELASATVKQATDLELQSAVKDLVAKYKDDQAKAKNEDGNTDAVFTKQQFQLNSVKCLASQESSDELLIDGHFISRDGTITNLDRIKYEGWEDGQMRYKDYEPCYALEKAGLPPDLIGDCAHGSADDIYKGRKLIEASLPGQGTYGLVIVIGEQDQGGFGDMMNDIYKKLKKEIDAALEAAGLAIGAALSTWLGPVGEIIGAALGWLLGKIVDWFVDLFTDNDDYITTKQWNMTLDSRKQKYIKGLENDPLPSPKGTWASPMKKWTLKGDGASYEMRLHWRFYA
jgi:hypothetical protein